MKNKLKLAAVIIFLVALTFLPRLYKVNAPLADWHSWRQVDTVSVTKFLIEDNFNLLIPRYHDVSNVQTGYQNPNGFRFVEFPIFNLLHAGLKLSTNSSFEFTGRLISIFAASLATVSLFLIGRKMCGFWTGFFASLFYAVLPFNVFFTRVILPDPLSVSLAVFSIYLFWEYIDRNNLFFLFSASIIFALALLVKPFAIFYAPPIAYLAWKKFGIKGIFQNIPLLIALDIALIPMLLWRAWIGTREHLVGVAHFMWAFNGDGIRFRPSFWFWIFGERIGKLILGYWGVAIFGLGLLSNKSKAVLTWMLLGSLLYVSIVATANVRHDYYQTFIIPPIALAMGLGVHTAFSLKFFNKINTALVVGFVSLLSIFLSLYFVKENYKINDFVMIEAGQRVNELVEEDALVIAPYNGNTAFLYQTGRSGWPVVTTDIDTLIERGADYFVSTTKGDTDSVNFKNRFKVVEETEKYIILDLHAEN